MTLPLDCGRDWPLRGWRTLASGTRREADRRRLNGFPRDEPGRRRRNRHRADHAATRMTILPTWAPDAMLDVIEAEHLVDHGLDPVRRDRAVHGLEHLRRADRDALDVGTPRHDRAGVEIGCRTREIADHGDPAADAPVRPAAVCLRYISWRPAVDPQPAMGLQPVMSLQPVMGLQPPMCLRPPMCLQPVMSLQPPMGLEPPMDLEAPMKLQAPADLEPPVDLAHRRA